jgi:hypothetical protein
MLSLVFKLFMSVSLVLPALQTTYIPTTAKAALQHPASKDEDLVKSSCRLWWGLPQMKTTSSKDMQAWAKKVLPTAGKALSKAAEAKKANSKWSQFQLEMATFYGAIYLGTDITYSGIMFKTSIEQNAVKYLSSVCAKRR